MLCCIIAQRSRVFVFTYILGYDLIDNASGDNKSAIFKRLLTETMLPSDLVAKAKF